MSDDRPPEEQGAHALFRCNALALAGHTGVAPESLPPLRRRDKVVADMPPADVLAAVVAGTSLTAAQVGALWKQATTASSTTTIDPYQRWLTHRYAAAQLATCLERPVPLAELSLPEISGYAALLWPLVHPLLQQAHPITRFLHARAVEPSHMTWTLETTYVGICITLYAAEQGHWLVVLNAELEAPPHAWVTVERTTARSVRQAAWEVLRIYELALDEVDIPAYQRHGALPICARCHAWCGWHSQCRRCVPRPVEEAAPRWNLLAGVYPSPPAYQEPWDDAYLLGHPLLESAIVALKAQLGFVPVAEAVDFVRQLEGTALPHLLRQAGFSFTEARRVLQEVQRGMTLAAALRKTLTRRPC